jgi:NADPH2:quinone reductase
MKAVRAHRWCEPEDLQIDEIEKPAPRKGDVLVRVSAAALNFPDMLMIRGQYQAKPPHPFIPGMEFSGTVESLGEGVGSPAPGTRVMAQCGMGAFSEYVTIPATSAQPVPESMTDEQAAVFPLVYQTSYFGIALRGAMQPGETVLVHSAAGGVGLAAVQIARALGAGRIIATVGSDEKLDFVREHGADVAINYCTQDFVEIVKKETGGKGADVIYDPVGGETGERSAKCVAFEGRIVIIGFTSGKFPQFSGNHILVKNYSVVGLHWGNYRSHNPALIDRAWKHLFELYNAGRLKPVVAATYPMDRVAEAMAFLGSRNAVGKIALRW